MLFQYRDAWAKRYRAKCVTSGRDRSTFGELVGELGVEETSARLKRFMASDDPFVVKTRHSVGAFRGTINQWIEGDGNGSGPDIERH